MKLQCLPIESVFSKFSKAGSLTPIYLNSKLISDPVTYVRLFNYLKIKLSPKAFKYSFKLILKTLAIRTLTS